MSRARPWTAAELELLVSRLDLNARENSDIIGRREDVVNSKRRELGVWCAKTPNRWTTEHDQILRDTANDRVSEVAKKLGRSEASIYNRRKTLGVKSSMIGDNERWTDEELEILKQTTNLRLNEVVKLLPKRSKLSIHSIRHKLKIRSKWTCIVCSDPLMAQGRYCEGHHWMGARWRNYKHRGETRGFGLNEPDFYALLQRPCAYCGGKADGVDRIDSKLGYVPGNVTAACWNCNAMKRDLPLDQWLEHMRRILEHMSKETR